MSKILSIPPASLFADTTYLHQEDWVETIRATCRAQDAIALIDWSASKECWVFHTLMCSSGIHRKQCSEEFWPADVKATGDQDVYVIKCDSNPPVYKIGISSDLISRLNSLQTASAFDLRIIAMIRGGGHQIEAELHRRFRLLRLRGEWFAESPELLSFISTECEKWPR